MQPDSNPGGTPPLPNEPYYRRGEQTRRWGVLLLLVGVVWLVFELTIRGSIFGFGLGLVERTTTVPPQTYTAQRVVITGVNDNVELIGWNQPGIQVAAVKHGFGWNAGAAMAALDPIEVVVDQRGDTLMIEVRRPPSLGTFIGRSPYAELSIALPVGVRAEVQVVSGDISVAETRADLTLNTVSGDLATNDTSGTLTANTTSGDISVQDHNGPLVAESVSGDIEARGALQTPRVTTVSGDVSLEGASGPVELRSISGNLAVADAASASLSLESTSGNIEVEGTLAPGSTNKVSNISGDVSLRLADPRNLRLEATTATGDLATDLARVAQERRRLSGTLGDGSTALTINTTSGDVEVSGE